MKLDLGCGTNKKEGFTGVDVLPFDGKVDVVMNLGADVWPWADESIEEVYSSHFVEHLDGKERVHFFNELHRVLKPGAKALIIVPSYKSMRAYGDPTHKWPPVCEFAFYYLDKEWRKTNAPHVGYTCDLSVTWGHSMAHPWSTRNQETQAFAINHYWNTSEDIIATVCRKNRDAK